MSGCCTQHSAVKVDRRCSMPHSFLPTLLARTVPVDERDHILLAHPSDSGWVWGICPLSHTGPYSHSSAAASVTVQSKVNTVHSSFPLPAPRAPAECLSRRSHGHRRHKARRLLCLLLGLLGVLRLCLQCENLSSLHL